ncbi:ribbon-helix-helix protein, CopG family [Lutibacter citreus]|uniref:ribbon-helix-helix protein, CopG family n=1 Tax=Lutibacter citreus TaxID=2138210 RepID=UPI000DBE8208|nr:ribbon-helix-helix protein, CopG family [Lutibacter citreus]
MKNKITIRIPDDLRDQLDEKAQAEGISTSELTRSILEEFCNPKNDYQEEDIDVDDQELNEINENEIDYEEECNTVKNELYELENKYELLKTENKKLEVVCEDLKKTDVVFSVDFLKLVCWIYYQRSASTIQLSNEQYMNFQETIINIHSSEKINSNLKNEFKKVLADLIKVQQNIFLKYNQLDFSKGNFPNFNYSTLNYFIFNKNCGVKNVTL